MHSLVSEEMEQYCSSFSSPESKLLVEINRQTHLRTALPVMLSGHLQGRVLSMLSHMIKPKNILEIGTFTGYSALCLAEGLQPGGQLISIDQNEETMEIAQHFIEQQSDFHIELMIGNAKEIVPTLQKTFDLVFIDADKQGYEEYADLVFDKLNQGGYILADNVLYHGDVLDLKTAGKNARAMHSYNQKMTSDKRFENVLLPIRDGILVSRKK